jgi:hypothetical protein
MTEENKIPEIKAPAPEQEVHFNWDKEKKIEKQELTDDEIIISEELKREIELMQVDDNLKKEAEQKANTIQALADDDKLKMLLQTAKEKGVVYAISVAKKMNDPFLLDSLHDILAREGYYQKFVK